MRLCESGERRPELARPLLDYFLNYDQMSNEHTFPRYETPILGTLVCLLNSPGMFTKQSSHHGAQNGYFLTFELSNFDLPSQLCGCIPGVGTNERCDYVNLVIAVPSWNVPYLITF